MFYMFIAFRLILTIFFFTDTASTEIYTLSLHDALPFCADLPTTDRGHDYITCLETDAAGNFYFVSWHGLYKVSPDGKKTELVSTGFRNPNGMSVGPDGTLTVAPQEGEWTPASAIFVAKPGSYHGYGGPKVTTRRPL